MLNVPIKFGRHRGIKLKIGALRRSENSEDGVYVSFYTVIEMMPMIITVGIEN